MAQPGKAPSSLEEIHRTFEAAFNAGDIEGLLALYESDAVLLPAPGQVARGQAAIREALRMFLNLQGRMTLKTLSTAKTGELALMHGEWTLTGSGPDGLPLSMGGKTAEVLRRQSDGRWLYVIDNPNAD